MSDPAGAGIRYGPDDRPPPGLLAAVTLQIAVVVALPLVYPVVIFRSAHTPLADIPPILSWGLIVLALVAVVQALRAPVGTGYLLPSLSSAIYLQPSIAAVGIGGRAALAAMTVCAGAFESAFGYVVTKFRALFPPVVTGVIVLIVGLEIGLVSITLGVDAVRQSLASPALEIGVSAITFGLIVAGVVWGNLWVRNVAPIGAVAVGTVLAVLFIDVPASDTRFVSGTSLLGSPGLPPFELSFDARLLVPFLVLGLAAGLRTVGVVMTLHDAARPDERRTDPGEVRRGVRNDGLGAVAAGMVGFPGVSSAPSAIGVSLASGIMSRVAAGTLAAVLLALAFCPRALAYLVTAPAAVVTALLLYYASFMIVGGVRLITRQPLGIRSTFIVGVSLSLAFGARVYGLTTANPSRDWVELISGSMMTTGALAAILLSLLFRIGQRRRSSFRLELTEGDVVSEVSEVRADMDTALAGVGAPTSLVQQATSLAAEAIRQIDQQDLADGEVTARVSTDDLSLRIELEYDGDPLEVTVARPVSDEDLTDENIFALGLSRYLDITRPDDVDVRRKGRHVRLRFSYDLV